MSHRKSSRRGRMNKSRRSRKFSGFNSRLVLVIVAALLIVAALAGAFVFFVFPDLQETLGIAPKPTSTPAPSARPTPTPTPPPPPLSTVDFSSLIKQPELSEKFIGFPAFVNGKLLYSGGEDENGNPAYKKMFLYDYDKGIYEDFTSPEPEHDDMINIVANDRFIAYLDHDADKSGGLIKAMTWDELTPFSIKRYYVGAPVLALSGDTLIWTERTGTRMDKLFALDLNTLENVTLETFQNSYYGLSSAGVSEGTIVYADYDPEQSTSESVNNPKSSIKTLKPGAARPTTYKPGTYVHDPQVSKGALAWIDANHAPMQKLYLRVGEAEPEMVAEDVVHFALADTFIVFSKDAKLFVRSLNDPTLFQITQDDTRSILIGLSENRVLFYDVTDEQAQGTRDILKFVEMPA